MKKLIRVFLAALLAAAFLCAAVPALAGPGDVWVINFYGIDGVTPDTGADVGGDYYLVGIAPNQQIGDCFAPIRVENGQAVIQDGDFTGGSPGPGHSYQLIRYTGSQPLTVDYLRNAWWYDPQQQLTKADDFGLYSFSGPVHDPGAHTFTFSAPKKNIPIVTVSVFENDETTPMDPDPQITGDYYVRAKILNKSDGTDAGWCLTKFSFSDTDTTRVPLIKFVGMNSNALENNNVVQYDPNVHELDVASVRLVRLNPGQNPNNYAAALTSAVCNDNPPAGYTFFETVSPTDDGAQVKLKKADKINYHVRLKFDAEDPSVVSVKDCLYVKVTVGHLNSDDTYGFVKVTDDMIQTTAEGEVYIDVPITEWKNAAGQVLPQEIFTGTEESIKVELASAPGNNPTPASAAALKPGQYVNRNRIVHYPTTGKEPDRIKVPGEGEQDWYDVITLSENKDEFPEYTLEYILNDYNIVTLCPNAESNPSHGTQVDAAGFAAGKYDGDFLMENHCMGAVLIRGDIIHITGTGVADSEYIVKPSVVGGYVPESMGPFINNRENNNNEWNSYIGSVNSVVGNTVNGVTATGSPSHALPGGILRGYTGSAGTTVANDDYLDWDRLQSAVINTSKELARTAVKNGSILNYTSQVIDVPAGANVVLNYPENTIITINIIAADDHGQPITDPNEIPATVVSNLGSGTYIPPKVTLNGSNLTTEEDGSGMSLLWNFPFAERVNVTTDVTPEFGHVVAPAAYIDVQGGNYSGCMVGNKVRSVGEGHLYPYRAGTLLGFYGDILLNKQVNGEEPSERQRFKFNLERLTPLLLAQECTNPGSDEEFWTWLMKVENQGSTITFNHVPFTSAGKNYFLVYEDLQDPPMLDNEQRDTNRYLIEVNVVAEVVSQTETILKMDTTEGALKYYKIIDEDNLVEIEPIREQLAGGAEGDIYAYGATVNQAAIEEVGSLTWDPDKEELTSDLTFLNNIEEVHLTLEGVKSVEGIDLSEKTFTFTVKDQDHQVVATGESQEDGSVVFTPIEYPASLFDDTDEEELFFTYTITEDMPAEATAENEYTVAGIKYDPTAYTVRVKVTCSATGVVAYEILEQPQDKMTFTNAYHAEGTGELEATKSFNDWKAAEKFTFVLEAGTNDAGVDTPMPAGAADGKLSMDATEDAPVVNFGTITYTAAGTYNYTITEQNGGLSYITYDTTAHNVVVTVVDNKDGTLTATAKYDGKDSLTITNTYSAKGEGELEATKSFNDWKAAEKFTFVLEAGTNDAGVDTPMPAGAADGKLSKDASEGTPVVNFGKITYTAAGTYNYTITEQDGGVSYITYDTEPHNVVVTVVDNHDGTLTATAKYDGKDSLTITNEYSATGEGELEATKSFNDWKAAEKFTFVLEAGTNDAGVDTPMPAGAADGKLSKDATEAVPVVNFGKITYTAAGTYNYTITEQDGGVSYITYDTEAHNVVVTVVDNHDGTLTATAKYDGEDSLTITNTYSAKGEGELEATKSFNDWKAAEKFTFVLEAGTNDAGVDTPMPAGAADGKLSKDATEAVPVVNFGTITYTAAGTYNYTITEQDGGVSYITYDTKPHNVVVTVVDNHDGTLTATAKYDGKDSLTITNTYSAEGEGELEATKSFNDWKAAEKFTFVLEAGTNDAGVDTPMPAGAADGKLSKDATEAVPVVNFGTITYTAAGTYNYTITEQDGGVSYITYDTKPHNVVVTVVDNHDGTLTATAKYDGKDSLTITNEYSATGEGELEATKSFNDWKAAEKFTFVLEAGTNDAGVDTPMPAGAADGKLSKDATEAVPVVNFGTITYTAAGTYNYNITEQDGGVSYITYDTEPHNVVVTVVDNHDGTLTATAKYDGEDSLTITNTYSAKGKGELEATKAINDWGKAETFTFTLAAVGDAPMPEAAVDGKVEKTITKGGEMTASFGEIEYTAAGEYKYTITETNDGVKGITYDTTAHEVVVTVVDNHDGTLTATAKYDGEDSLTITNTYSAKGSTELEATKAINDWGKAENFTFTLAAVGDAPMPEAAVDGKVVKTVNKDDLTAKFGTITYTAAGEYKYTITETDDGVDGITYDTKPHNVVVTVTDNHDGTLTATAKYDGGESLTITNVYNASGEKTLLAAKAINDWGQAESFTFTLAAVGDAPMPAEAVNGKVEKTVTKDNQTANFGTIKYTAEGEYKYTITETDDGVAGITYDTEAHEVVVKVVDNHDGSFTVTAKYDGEDSLTITNEYKAEGSTELEATKAINDWGKAESFTFTLAAVGDAPMPEAASEGKVTATVTKGGSLTASFGKIKYTAAGEYKYTITETDGGVDGITYDTTAHEVVVTVVDNHNGTLTATAKYDGGESLTITNEYSAEGSTELEATKAINDWGQAESFTFTLAAVGDAPMPKDAADGQVVKTVNKDNLTAKFGTIKYTAAGEYKYTITETDDGVDGITYDTTPHNVVVTVVDNHDGTLTATAKYDGGDSLTITNKYSAEGGTELQATKAINDWGQAESFTFTLAAVGDAPMPADAENGQVVKTVNKDNLTAKFGTITYTAEGEYKYTITETDDGVDGITYDTKPHNVVVTVVDNHDGSFTATPKYDGGESLTITNVYNANGEKNLLATKAINDWGEAESFTFTLEAEDNAPMPADAADGKVVKTVTKDNQTADFGTITYTAEGEYRYTITETDDGVAGITYDTTPHNVVVTVVDNHDGSFTITAKYDDADSLTITNEYKAEGSTELEATKSINDWGQAENFTFTLAAVGDAPMPADAADGKVVKTVNKDDLTAKFGTITYTAAGEYKYTITETDDGVDGITYDTEAHEVVVTVVDNHDGTLTVTAKYDGEGSLTITNEYTAEGKLTVEAKKSVDGAEPDEGQNFQFQLTGDKIAEPIVVYNDHGSIAFEDVVTYSLADAGKTFTYTLTEIGEYSGYIIDSTVVTVTAAVTDNHDGSLNVAKTYKVNNEPVELYTFHNTSLTCLNISKQANGGDEGDVFTFRVVLSDKNGSELTGTYDYAVFDGGVTDDSPARTGKLSSGGTIELTRDQLAVISDVPTGTTAKVTELDEGSLQYTTTVDNKEGRETEVTIEAEGTTVEFVNTLITKDFTCWKVWEGADGGIISLTLYKEDADGKLVALDPQPEYTAEDGQYIYKDLPARNPDGSEIVYAAKEKAVSGYITVYDNGETTEEGRSGKSNAVYDNGTIRNRAVTSIRVRKVWSGSANHPDITLTLFCNGIVYHAKCTGPDADGWYRWNNLPVAVDGKTAVYTVKEMPLNGWTTSYSNTGAHAGDKTQAYNGGTITNSTVPKTGDRTPMILMILLAALSAAGLGGVILFNRRRARM